MDKTRFLPPDPVEAAQVPVEGVDLPEGDTASQGAIDDLRQRQAFPENEGVVKRELPDTADVDLTTGPQLDEAVQAAQRGRTA